MVFDRLSGIKAPDPWKDQTSWMSSGVSKHRSPDDGEGVSPPYYGMVPIGCAFVVWVDRARYLRKAVYLGEGKL